jgi:hypothetical protein
MSENEYNIYIYIYIIKYNIRICTSNLKVKLINGSQIQIWDSK